jgi:hypothetical protein
MTKWPPLNRLALNGKVVRQAEYFTSANSGFPASIFARKLANASALLLERR